MRCGSWRNGRERGGGWWISNFFEVKIGLYGKAAKGVGVIPKSFCLRAFYKGGVSFWGGDSFEVWFLGEMGLKGVGVVVF